MQALIMREQGSQKIVSIELEQFGIQPLQEFPIHTLASGNFEDFLKLSYFGQSISQVFIVLQTATLQTLPHTIEQIPWEKYFNANTTFRCTAKPEHLIPGTIDKIIQRTQAKVQLQNPKVIISIVELENTIYICLDCSSQLLYKREYKIFNNPAALRATIGYQALLAAGFSAGKDVADPFCGGGTIPIEAAIANTGHGPHHFQKDKFCFKYWKNIDEELFNKIITPLKPKESRVAGYDWNITAIKSAEKNANIADVPIEWARLEVNYLPSKFEDNSLDCIVTHPPAFNSRDFSKKLHKNLHELFVGASMILKKKGRLCIVTNDVNELLTIENPLKHIETHTVYMGQSVLYLAVFGK